MENQKRFQKKTLNSDDHKGMKNGAKALKGAAGAVVAVAALVVNKDNLKVLGKNVGILAAKLIKR